MPTTRDIFSGLLSDYDTYSIYGSDERLDASTHAGFGTPDTDTFDIAPFDANELDIDALFDSGIIDSSFNFNNIASPSSSLLHFAADTPIEDSPCLPPSGSETTPLASSSSPAGMPETPLKPYFAITPPLPTSALMGKYRGTVDRLSELEARTNLSPDEKVEKRRLKNTLSAARSRHVKNEEKHKARTELEQLRGENQFLRAWIQSQGLQAPLWNPSDSDIALASQATSSSTAKTTNETSTTKRQRRG